MIATTQSQTTPQKKQKRSWSKGIPRSLYEEILSYEPLEVRIERNNNYMRAYIVTNSESVVGTSICSTIDKFDFKKGKVLALGRALAALKKKCTDYPVRVSYSDFPKNWTLKQVENVMCSPVMAKSAYLG